MPPRAVFFDLVGTLVRPRASIGYQYAVVARRHGVEADPARLEAAFAREMADAPALEAWDAAAADAAERSWWQAFVARVFRSTSAEGLDDPCRFEAFFDDLYRHFTTADAWELYPDVLPALDKARLAGLVVGLITNYDTRVYALLESLALADRLDSVTIPATAAAQKPARRIFDQALAAHGLAAADAAYVGDSLEDDYKGARAAGMEAVLLDRNGQHRALPGLVHAASLTEALSLLLERDA
ncbi:MAG TPA: HAD-IA family hydrolase [Vicinamibacterales bacterium]|nr:HAD-IA family hydrolase [Vicinamibacterales bacterium]